MADHQTAATGDQNCEPTAEPAGSTPSGTANQNKHVDRSSGYHDPYPNPESALVASLMELRHDSPGPATQPTDFKSTGPPYNENKWSDELADAVARI
ncbi:hypothetical protein PCASD_19917 [Puccinia coronata f. sp. avenae]|uniref:Uncharacterized protein n=1 Tax=Puccinia coronata f. sp. avenae TaxID=200324 RepID=A0A2N5U7U7_9BASI|nr:hypothetical protein PCASD_19917 [Puccinia coronata f. sp. avenae]